MSKAGSISRAEPRHFRSGANQWERVRGVFVLMVAAALLVGGAYYVVHALAAPGGWISQMASNASTNVDGRTQALASQGY